MINPHRSHQLRAIALLLIMLVAGFAYPQQDQGPQLDQLELTDHSEKGAEEQTVKPSGEIDDFVWEPNYAFQAAATYLPAYRIGHASWTIMDLEIPTPPPEGAG